MPRARRIHLLAHANPLARDLSRLRFDSAREYVRFIQSCAGDQYDVTHSPEIFAAREESARGGRTDDRARVRDLQHAIDDPRCAAIIALSGGAWFGRIIPQLRLDRLARRTSPIVVSGFSEMTSLVNLLATFRAVRAYYWLCPNYLAWKIRPPSAARAASAGFWRDVVPAWIDGRQACPEHGPFTGLDSFRAELVRGRARSGRVKLIGGCLSVLAATLQGPLAGRLRPHGKWLVIEDVNEATYRIDRCLATLKLAGWFEKLAGVIVGDFHTAETSDQRHEVAALLRFHTPTRLPITVADRVGHVWPMAMVRINGPTMLRSSARRLDFCL